MSLHHIDKQKIKVTLQMKISFGSDTESYELITFGTSMYKGTDVYLQYTEESEAGTTNTTIKHKPNETLLLRSGAFKMRQLFRLQETTNGHYESLYGMLGLSNYNQAYFSPMGRRGAGRYVNFALSITYARKRTSANMK